MRWYFFLLVTPFPGWIFLSLQGRKGFLLLKEPLSSRIFHVLNRFHWLAWHLQLHCVPGYQVESMVCSSNTRWLQLRRWKLRQYRRGQWWAAGYAGVYLPLEGLLLKVFKNTSDQWIAIIVCDGTPELTSSEHFVTLLSYLFFCIYSWSTGWTYDFLPQSFIIFRGRTIVGKVLLLNW